MKHTFKTSTVLTIYTGVVLDKTFTPAADLAEHLFPGIGPIGIVGVAGKMQQILLYQHPKLAMLDPVPSNRAELVGWLEKAEKVLGEKLEVDSAEIYSV